MFFALLPLARPTMAQALDRKPFSVIVLGDLHYDRAEDHDMDWLAREHPGDVRQVADYTRITRDCWPLLFAELRKQASAVRPPVAFVAQLGDLTEGLCGSRERAEKQLSAALAAVQDAKLGAPFYITKGNHDITGPGAPEAYDAVVLPFMQKEAGRDIRSASFALRRGDSLFVFYDSYSAASLPWLERTLAEVKAARVFVLTHQPIVPIGARSLWHVFSRPEEAAQYRRLLDVLGSHRAIVLCAHLHKYSALVRKAGGGRFVQLELSSVLPSTRTEPAGLIEGADRYGPDLVNLEPGFEPQTVAARRAALSVEAPEIAYFDYADAPGYAILTVDGDRVEARLFAGSSERPWRTLSLSDLLKVTAEQR